jgi:hypothetical protein
MNNSTPDVSFEPIQSVRSGFSKPVFIIKQGDDYYITKVVWPYSYDLAGDDVDLLNAISNIANAFDSSPDTDLMVREVLEEDLRHITEGFAR